MGIELTAYNPRIGVFNTMKLKLKGEINFELDIKFWQFQNLT